MILGGVECQKRRALYFRDKPDLLQFAGSGIEAEAINPFTLRASIGSNVYQILICRMFSGKGHSHDGEERADDQRRQSGGFTKWEVLNLHNQA